MSPEKNARQNYNLNIDTKFFETACIKIRLNLGNACHHLV
jgi:hypothetical protein